MLIYPFLQKVLLFESVWKLLLLVSSSGISNAADSISLRMGRE